MSADKNISLDVTAKRTAKLEIVTPALWLDDESLTDVLVRLGYTHIRTAMGHKILRGDKEAFSTTCSDAYERAALWLIRTRQVVLSPRLERCVRGWARDYYGLGAEVDVALAQAVRS
jgi:hypothetical protein